MSVFIPIPITELEQASLSPTRTYKLDLNSGRIFNAGSSDGLEAVKQSIVKSIITPRFQCAIYDDQYGSEIKQAVLASNVTREYIETEVPDYTREACMVDERVISLHNFKVDFDDENVFVEFDANTTFGDSVVVGVI